MRSPIARMMPREPTDEEHLEDMRRAAWRDQGVLVVFVEEVHEDWLRQALVNLAEQRYGRRKTNGKET